MKTPMVVRLISFASALAVLPLLITGCARTPSGLTQKVLREMSFRVAFSGPINENDYYFVPIDVTGGGLGPVPVFPNNMTGLGWVTGSATHYIQYHQRQYTIFKIVDLSTFQTEPVGAPVRFTLPDAGSNELRFTIDLNTIQANSDTIDVNIIATDQPLSSVRTLDALGLRGNDFISLDITSTRTVTNSESPTPEQQGDVLDQNLVVQPINEQTKPIDIIDWTITTNI